MKNIHVIITTYSIEYLRYVLIGIKYSTLTPKTVVFSCDTDNSEVGNILCELSKEFSIDIIWAYRPNTGCPRIPQTRNNGVRALMLDNHCSKDGVLVFLDGDTVPEPTLFENYLKDSEKYELIIGWRVDYNEEEMGNFSEKNIVQGLPPVKISKEQIQYLNRLNIYQKKHMLLKKIGFTKPHKPKLMGCNHAVSLRAFCQVNGYNEDIEGTGCEDDDFIRRLYKLGIKPKIAVKERLAYHLYHKPRSRDDEKSKNAWNILGERNFKIYSKYGLDNPRLQDDLKIVKFLNKN